jgi:hypothetical protein
MSMSVTAGRLLRCLIWLAPLSTGCGSADAQAGRLTETQLPSRADFPVVSAALQRRCATLDCHGQVGRNLRLYGFGGLRLSTPEAPIADPIVDPTTSPELDSSYASTIGLEPEALWRVLAQGADPNELSLIRKTRGIEKHKGGQLAREGDLLDRCIVLWLTGHADQDPCQRVVDAPRPEFE